MSICFLCEKTLVNNAGYSKHLKTHLKNYNNMVEKKLILDEMMRLKTQRVTKNFNCYCCNKTFRSKYSLDRHNTESCKKPENEFRRLRLKLIDLLPQITQHQKREISDLCNLSFNQFVADGDNSIPSGPHDINFNSNNNSHNNINSNNHQNNIQVKVNVVNLGEEKVAMLEDDSQFLNEVVGILEANPHNALYQGKPRIIYNSDSMNNAIVKTFEKVHCNADYPENHNLYASNKNVYSAYQVFEDGEWKITNDLEPIKRIVINTKNNLANTLNLAKADNEHDEILILDRGIDQLNLNYPSEAAVQPKICRKILLAAYNYKEILKESNQNSKTKLTLIRKKNIII